MHIHFNIKNSIAYALILTAGIIFASFYGGLLPFVILYGILLLVPVSFICIVLNYHFLSVYQELDAHRVIKGEQHELFLSFDNEGILPIHDMKLILHSDRCDFDGIRNEEQISIDPFKKFNLNTKTTCIYGGTYYIGLKELGFTDVFKIFTVRFKVPYSFKAIVSPGITDIANGYMDIENTVNSIGSKSDVKFEEIPGNDMRSYYPGDHLNSINWKVSARLSRLMVRIPDRQDTRRITLFLEASNVPERMQDTEYLKRRDFFLEFAVSSVWYFARRGIPVFIVYPSGRIIEKQVDSYETFRDFYSDVSQGIYYRSDDEKYRMHKLTQERRRMGYGDETRVIILEDEWPGEDFCIIAD